MNTLPQYWAGTPGVCSSSTAPARLQVCQADSRNLYHHTQGQSVGVAVGGRGGGSESVGAGGSVDVAGNPPEGAAEGACEHAGGCGAAGVPAQRPACSEVEAPREFSDGRSMAGPCCRVVVGTGEVGGRAWAPGMPPGSSAVLHSCSCRGYVQSVNS